MSSFLRMQYVSSTHRFHNLGLEGADSRASSGDDLCQHHIQTTDGNCSMVEFAASSNNETEELILFTDGPCRETSDSWV